MAVITISKIQLRRGLAEDLPGAPVSGAPTTPTTPLDVGELAFTTDTGQVFVGPDLTADGSTQTRYTFPYQNVEVLTEHSTAALQSSFDGMLRDVQTGYTTAVTIAPSGGTPTAVTVASGNSTVPLTLSLSGGLANTLISYFLFTTSNTPIRMGTMQVLYDGSGAGPMLIDDSVAYRNLNLGLGDDPNDAATVYGEVQFSVALAGPGGSKYVALLLNNGTASNLVLRFRLDRAQP